MNMLIPKPRKSSTQAELWERYQAGDPTVETSGDDGKYQYLVDYWVEPRIYSDAPATGWGSESEDEDKSITKEEEFVNMITSGPKSIQFELNRSSEEKTNVSKPKSYTFQIPIAINDYKAAPFDYQTINNASMVMVGGLTRSGRIYEPTAKKAISDTPPLSNDEEKRDDEKTKLAKLMKASEFKVVEQLAKTPAQISLMSLLISSDIHREALFKVLKEVKIPEDVPEGALEHIISSVFTSDQISFSSEELGEEGSQHNRALFIVAKSNGKIISRVLIDNGSSLNVCPLATLNLLEVEPSNIKSSAIMVRAFDGSRREIIGEVELEVTIGPQAFLVPFQVIDIPRTFNLLLGRPWIHTAGAIPSSLHQRVKFVANGQIVTVMGEQDYAIYQETAIPYIGRGGEEDFGLQMFEEVCMINEEKEDQIGTFGLGYYPTQVEVTEMKNKMKRGKISKEYDPVIEIPHIKCSFPRPHHIQKSDGTEEVDLPKEMSLKNWFSIPSASFNFSK